MNVRPDTCERAAQLVSLHLDGQLSDLERALLARHLRRCAACEDEARQMTSFTRLLRSVPLEPIHLAASPARRRANRVASSLVLALTSVACVAAWLGLALSSGPQRSALSVSARSTAVRGLPNDRFDWAAGPPRTTEIVQFVPGGRFTFGS